MTKEQAIQKVLDLAVSQIGYTEGARNNNKYANDFDTKWTDWFNGRKNFNDWCAVFVNWLFVESFGEDIASKMLNHGCQYGKLSAGVQYLYRSLMLVDRVGKEPHPGDIIFYHNDKYEGLAQLCHVGIVWKVNGDYVTTIEGNSGKNSTEVATREIRKTYDTKEWGVYGFGYPDYSAAEDVPSKYPPTPFEVTALKKVDIREGCYSDTPIIGSLKKGQKAIIVSCEGSTGDYGRLKTDTGYIYLDQPDRLKINGKPTPDPKPKTLDGYTVGKMYRVDVKAGLWERKTPTTVTDSNKVKVLKYGTVVTAKDLKKVDGNTWMQIADGNWVAAHYKGDRFVV